MEDARAQRTIRQYNSLILVLNQFQSELHASWLSQLPIIQVHLEAPVLRRQDHILQVPIYVF